MLIRKGRRVAIAAVALGSLLCGAAGLWFRQDLRDWFALRRVHHSINRMAHRWNPFLGNAGSGGLAGKPLDDHLRAVPAVERLAAENPELEEAAGEALKRIRGR